MSTGIAKIKGRSELGYNGAGIKWIDTNLYITRLCGDKIALSHIGNRGIQLDKKAIQELITVLQNFETAPEVEF